MCGIAGFFTARPLAHEDETTLHNMIGRLRHRGPDGTGFHLKHDKGLAMGHARLSIIDLLTGDQPLIGSDGQSVFTGNGEFYDYKRIRAELVCDGAVFQTKSDSEIALHLYERYGLDFVRHLRGEFGFALWDGRHERLILVRDRFGIKPLFFHVTEDTVSWGSEIKALFANPRVPRRLDAHGAIHQLMHTMVPGTTAFEDIHALKPGHMLIITREKDRLKVAEQRYWDLEFPREEDHNTDIPLEKYADVVRSQLLQAVAHRLEADVPVGCYLSGGIDSCSMLGLASAVQQSPVKAFTISFDNDAYDEASIAREMAERTRADQELLNLDALSLYGDNYINTMWHAERTFYNTLGVAKWCMSRRVHECGYKVVVTGEGADELFGGYPAFKRDMFLHGYADHEAAERAQLIAAMEESNRIFRGAILAETETTHPAFDSLCGFTPSWIQPWIRTLKLARPLLSDDIQATTRDYDPIVAIADALDPEMIKGRHPLDKAQYTWSKTMLECQILNWGGDRVDMANAMESRPAFLDHYVAEAAIHIPPRMRIKGATEKYVLREAMKHLLPKVLYERQKFAFMAPPGHTDATKRKAVKALLDQYVSRPRVEQAGIFDPDRLNTFIEEYRTDTDPVSLVQKDALINHIIGMQILHDQFIAHDAIPPQAESAVEYLMSTRNEQLAKA